MQMFVSLYEFLVFFSYDFFFLLVCPILVCLLLFHVILPVYIIISLKCLFVF